MNTTARTTAAVARPSRRAQVAIWVLFLTALLTGFSMSSYQSATDAPVPAVTSTSAATSTITVAAGAPGADSALLRDKYKDDASQLLPAYRWSGSLQLPSVDDYGMIGTIGQSMLTNFANLLFFIAAWIWTILLWLVKLAVGTDLVSGAAGQLDGLFQATAKGLGKTGLPILAVCLAVFLGAMKALKGKLNQAVSMVLGAALVVGALSFFTAAAGGPQHTYRIDGSTVHAASVGSPAYLAQRGNNFVNDMVDNVVTGFGATNRFTQTVSSGAHATRGDTDGATCNFYVQQLYATYRNYSALAGGNQGRLEANSLSMVSFMWQRSLYDNWTVAAFGTTGDGARIACHELESNRGTSEPEQFAMVGGSDSDSTAKYGPYAGMHSGPFYLSLSGKRRDQIAAHLAWAACGGSNGQQARAGWNDPRIGVDADHCKDWWTYKPSDKSWGDSHSMSDSTSVGINASDDKILDWDTYSDVESDTTWSGDGGATKANGLEEVRTVVGAFYGHNGGTRLLSGFVSIASAALYAWAFGAAAIGTIATQIGLLFFLSLLPYTLLLLAFPQKDGGRNKSGVRMLKMTGAFFGGKVVFLALMGVTVQLMSVLFTISSSFGGGSGTSAAGNSIALAAGSGGSGGSVIWQLLIPAATIFVLRSATKALGLGDLMSLSGAAGFATSAVMSGKENKKARSQMQGALNGSLVGKTLNRADKAVKGNLKRGGAAVAKSPKSLVNSLDSHKSREDRKRELDATRSAVAAGQLSPELGAAVAGGKMSLAEATAIHNGALDKSLLPAVQSGQLTPQQAMEMTQAMNAAREAAKNTPPAVGGFAGAQQRLGTLGADDKELEPVFAAAALDAAADKDVLRTLQTDRRHQLDVKNKDVDEAEWEKNAIDSVVSSMEALRAGSQGAEIGRSLSLGEVTAERARIAAETGVPENLVLLGDSGAPPLIAAVSRDADTGQFQWPEGLSDEAAIKVAMNPLNYLDISKLPSESVGEFHLRAALSLQMAGGMDLEGNFADIIKAEGINVDTVDGRAELLKAIKGESSIKLEDIKLAVPDIDRRAIGVAVADFYPKSSAPQQLAQVQEIHTVEQLASGAQAQAVNLNAHVQQTVQQILSAPDHADTAQAMDRMLRLVEEKIPAAVADLGAVSMEASVLDRWVGADGLDHGSLMDQAKEMSKVGEKIAQDISHELTNRVAQIKLAAPAMQPDMLKNLTRYVSAALEECSSDMSDQVRKLLENAADADATRQQHLASQLRAPVRGSDFSGGARELS